MDIEKVFSRISDYLKSMDVDVVISENNYIKTKFGCNLCIEFMYENTNIDEFGNENINYKINCNCKYPLYMDSPNAETCLSRLRGYLKVAEIAAVIEHMFDTEVVTKMSRSAVELKNCENTKKANEIAVRYCKGRRMRVGSKINIYSFDALTLSNGTYNCEVGGKSFEITISGDTGWMIRLT